MCVKGERAYDMISRTEQGLTEKAEKPWKICMCKRGRRLCVTEYGREAQCVRDCESV